jgi:hypothetical protein
MKPVITGNPTGEPVAVTWKIGCPLVLRRITFTDEPEQPVVPTVLVLIAGSEGTPVAEDEANIAIESGTSTACAKS